VIYLLHFERSYKHARHYLGYTENLEQRLAQHRSGRGSPFVAAAVAEGIRFDVARTWPGDRTEERRLHNYKNSAARLCPLCRTERAIGTPGEPADKHEGDVDAAIVRVLSDGGEPMTLGGLRARLRLRGHRDVGSLHGRLELLAAQGRVVKCELLGEIAWTAAVG
jgi:hypothetical protein